MVRICNLLAVVLIALGGCITDSFGQQTDNQLLNKRVDLQLEKGTLTEALIKLATQDVPIGIECAPGDKQTSYLKVDLRGVPLHEALDLIVQGETQYQWMVRDGVVNITPVYDRDPILEKFLLVQVNTFDPPKGLRNYFLRDAVLEIPEVGVFLKAHGLTASHGGDAYVSKPYDPKLDLRVYGVDVRSILNRICRETQMKIWSVSRYGLKNEQLHVSF
jgi:hypothetical protein